MSEENSILSSVEQFLDRKQDVPAEKVARFFESVAPELRKMGFAVWQFEFIPGRVVTAYPGGSYTEDSMLVHGLGVYEFINIDSAIKNPSIAAVDISKIAR